MEVKILDLATLSQVQYFSFEKPNNFEDKSFDIIIANGKIIGNKNIDEVTNIQIGLEQKIIED